MSKRLKASKFSVSKHITAAFDLPPLAEHRDRIDIWTIPTMAEAVASLPKRLLYFPTRNADRREVCKYLSEAAVRGNPERLAASLDDSESLIADAIAADQRLARRSMWTRGEEGEIVCPALLSQSDDAPCFYRRRTIVGQPNGAEPVKVVISTDSHEIKPKTAAAFIAVARLVQQYRPLQIFWQGSWLAEPNRNTGWVFHVPLVNGDMDYSRLDFCINDIHRDSLSWAVMMTRACEETHATWNGCSLQAEHSYMDDAKFVSHYGISPTGEDVAAHAASWLGLDPLYQLRWEYEAMVGGAAVQLPEPRQEYTPRKLTKEEEQKRDADSKRWEKERQERLRSEAEKRIQNLNIT